MTTFFLFVCSFMRPIDEHSLDFWRGKWEVFVGHEKVGDDRVETFVGAGSLTEDWKDVYGGVGKSLFYYDPAKKQWKQIWIVEDGSHKEKASEPFPNGIRFVGTVFRTDGTTYRDRTTLTKLEGGRVRQVIEATRDGKNWMVEFVAEYRRASSTT